jgi:hypothetical protein
MHRRPFFSTARFVSSASLSSMRYATAMSAPHARRGPQPTSQCRIAPCNERDFVLELLRIFVVRPIEQWMRPKFGFLARLHWC